MRIDDFQGTVDLRIVVDGHCEYDVARASPVEILTIASANLGDRGVFLAKEPSPKSAGRRFGNFRPSGAIACPIAPDGRSGNAGLFKFVSRSFRGTRGIECRYDVFLHVVTLCLLVVNAKQEAKAQFH